MNNKTFALDLGEEYVRQLDFAEYNSWNGARYQAETRDNGKVVIIPSGRERYFYHYVNFEAYRLQ